jgi:CheY-like chemotaxis protein
MDTPKKILLIEDDKFLRELIVKKLVKEGFIVLEANDGEEGLTKISQEKPDLVLLDLILPGVDGFELLQKAQEDPFIKNVPIIVLSNLGQKEDIDRCMKSGAVDYLIKAHLTPIEIVEKVKKALNL